MEVKLEEQRGHFQEEDLGASEEEAGVQALRCCRIISSEVDAEKGMSQVGQTRVRASEPRQIFSCAWRNSLA